MKTTMDLDFSHLYWHEKPELLGVTKLNGMDTIVRIDVSASAYEIVGSLPPGFRKSDAFFRSEIRSAGRNCRDGIYHIQGFSLSYQPEGGSWHSVIRDVHIVKTFGGASPYLPVRYLGNGRFAVAKTTRDDVDISEIPAQEETLLGAAEAVTLLVDGLSGKILKQSEPYIYNHNPPLKIPDTWWADGFQLPAPDDAEPPRKSLFHWNETTRELRFTGDKLITLTEDDELLESDDGQFMLIYQKCPRGDGKTRTKVPFRILDGRTGGSYSTEVESDFYEVWTEASWETLCPP